MEHGPVELATKVEALQQSVELWQQAYHDIQARSSLAVREAVEAKECSGEVIERMRRDHRMLSKEKEETDLALTETLASLSFERKRHDEELAMANQKGEIGWVEKGAARDENLQLRALLEQAMKEVEAGREEAEKWKKQCLQQEEALRTAGKTLDQQCAHIAKLEDQLAALKAEQLEGKGHTQRTSPNPELLGQLHEKIAGLTKQLADRTAELESLKKVHRTDV
eukprot:Sspe_Gene.105390::Locus_82428_Transcript_1_1_Confidence_1.000_Length_744::g.105390::m.105390